MHKAGSLEYIWSYALDLDPVLAQVMMTKFSENVPKSVLMPDKSGNLTRDTHENYPLCISVITDLITTGR